MTPRAFSPEERLRRRRESEWHGERPWPAGPLPSGVDREEDLFHHGRRTLGLRLVRHELVLAVGGILAAIVLGLLLLPLAIKALGALPALLVLVFLVVYIAILTFPVWMAALVDDYEDHRKELTEE